MMGSDKRFLRKLPRGSDPSLWVHHGAKRVAMIVEAAGGGRKTLIIDGERLAAFADIRDFKFSPDGRRFACVVREGKAWSILRDGERLPHFDFIGFNTL